MDNPAKIIVFSRDEAKQHAMRLAFLNKRKATDEVIYENFRRVLDFRVGDVRDPGSVRSAFRGADLVIHAAALKQVPTCEYFPFEAVRTNIEARRMSFWRLKR
jgi:UDP-glucose 4-epimerase